MHLNSWFEKAMSYNEYVDQMTRNKEKMLSIYERYHLKDNHVKKLGELQEKNLRVIALTEDWCGDAMVNNPILMKIAETANIEVRFLLRNQNLELMDQYLTNGKSRSIPIYIFIDKDGKEVAVWDCGHQKFKHLSSEKGLLYQIKMRRNLQISKKRCIEKCQSGF